MDWKAFFIAVTLGVPTSAWTAVAWRLSDDSETWSKSIILIFPTPLLINMLAAQLPTPPNFEEQIEDVVS
jgi:hypothetical protein